MKKTISNLIALLFCFQIQAQLQFNAGINQVDFKSFNTTLFENEFPSIEENVFTFSILSSSGEKNSKRITSRTGIMINRYESILFNPGQLNYNELNLRTVGFISGTGFKIINKKGITLGPSVDMLIVQNKLSLIKNLPFGLAFNSFLSNDVSSEEFRNIRFMFDGRLNLIFKFNNAVGKTSYGIGLTGGYRFDPFTPNWKYERSVKVKIEGTQQTGPLLGIIFTMKGPNLMPPKPKIKQEKS